MAMSPYPNPFPEGEGTVRRRSVISHAIAIPLSLQDEGFPGHCLYHPHRTAFLPLPAGRGPG